MVCDAAAGGLSRPAHDDDKPRNRTCPQHGALLRNSRHIGGKDNFAKEKVHNLVDVGASRPHVFDGTLGRCAASAERHLQYLPRCRPATLPEGGRRRAARLTMLLCQSFTAHPPTTCPFRTHHPLARLFARYGRTSTSFGAHSLYTDAPLITAIRHATGRKQAELV